MENFLDHGDEGEIWFGKAVERRVIDWMKANYKDSRDLCILDLGCGNGHFTKKLLEAGWNNAAALDYSLQAVQLARKLVGSEDRIFQADILKPESIPEGYRGSFDLIVDKGTFDAISLNPDYSQDEKVSKTRIIAETFKTTLKSLLKPASSGSKFIITSCNWTSQELELIFAPEFKNTGEIAHTKFVFGGKSGQDVSTIIFQLDC